MVEKLKRLKRKLSRSDVATDKGHIGFMFAGLIVAMLMSSLSQTIFSTALPTIVGELHGIDRMMWVITAYILAATIMLPVYGKLGDLMGRKKLLIGAIGLFMLGSVIGGLANSMNWLIIGRIIMGLGGGGLMILAQSIIADVVPPRDRGKYMGVMGGVFAVSSVAGPLLGGWFTETIGWRWGFWINIPLGALAIAAASAFLHQKKIKAKPSIDALGMGLMAVMTTTVVLVTTWAGQAYDWLSPQIISLMALAVITGLVFIFVERRATEPVMPPKMFRDRNFLLTTIAGLITGIAMFGVLAYMPTYLQMVSGLSATAAGMLMLPMMAGLLVTSITVGQLISRYGRYKWYPVIGSIILAVSLALLSTLHPEMALWRIGTYLSLMGIGLGMSTQVLVLIVQNAFPNSLVGTATATTNYFRQVGASVGSAVVGSVFAGRLAHLLAERLSSSAAASAGDANSLTPTIVNHLPEPVHGIIIGSYSQALTPIFLAIVPLVIIAIVLLLFVYEKPLRTRNK